MASTEVAPQAEQKRCFCALCTNSFLLQEDNLYRRRNLHDLCRLVEESSFPPLEPGKKDDLFLLLEGELKKRKLISLCNGCNVLVGSMLREREIAKEYEAVVNRQQMDLNRDLAGFQRHNMAVSQHFTMIKDTVEAADAEDFKFNTIRDVESGLRLFRERLTEMAKELERYCIGVQRRQLVLQDPGKSTAMDFLARPLQLQVAARNPIPGPSTTGFPALLPSHPTDVNRKRTAFPISEDEENNPPKQMKTSVGGVNAGGPPMPDFKERVISRAKTEESVDDLLFATGSLPSHECSMLYDAAKDRLTFCNIEVKINKEDRSLQCGTCGNVTKQNVKTPGQFYQVEQGLKEHILHKHFNVWKFQCTSCGKGFARKYVFEKHDKECRGNGGASAQSDGRLDQVQISNVGAVAQVKTVLDAMDEEKMEEDEEMQEGAKVADAEEEKDYIKEEDGLDGDEDMLE